MRLLFVSNLFPDTREPYRGLDNATLLHELARECEVRVLALRPVLPWSRSNWQPRAVDVALKPEFVATAYIPKFGHRWNHRLYARALRCAMRRLSADWNWDAILAAWLHPDACAVARLNREFRSRFVAIAQGSDVHQYLRLRARREVIVSHLSDASAIINRSAELACLLKEAGLPPDRLHPIHNGVDLTVFRPPRAEDRLRARAEFGLPGESRVVLFVGNLLPIKDPGALLRAHAALRARPSFEDLYLLMVGAGPLRGELEKVAAAAGNRSHVIFAGPRDREAVARAMQAADVLALPSLNEGVPNVVLEAFASGLPVVASEVGGIPEVHPGGDFGQMIPPRNAVALTDAIEAILSKPLDASRISAHAQSFTWRRTAEAYLQLLRGAERVQP